ncbi:MAG TPA: TonB-dependent receptor, partial [Saprospiraceae bacterium]|nr:TonB-dependent receptor [Saprospiraceae bacterium]
RLLNTARQDNFGGTGIFTTLDDEERLSRSLGHRFGMLLRHRPDSAQRMSLRLDGGFSDAFLQTRSSTRSLNSESVLQNANLRQYRLDGRAFNLRSAFSWQHRFRRSGRSLSTSANARWAERPEQGALGAENRFTVDPTLSDTVRQRQQAGETTRQYGLTVLYTEPLGRRQYLKLEAMQQWENGARRKDFFDQASGQEVYNPLLSRAFSRDFELSRAGLAYLRNRKKYTLTAALNYQQSRLHGQMEGLAPLSWQFRRWLPALFWDYEFKTAHRMEAAYTTRLREPALEELQPLPDNSDPLNVYIGNPALRPEYVHEWRANYFRYDAFSFMSLFANLTASYTQDKIAQSGSVNALLQRSTTPLNVDHEWRLRGSVQFGAPLRPLPLSTNIRLNSTLTQGPLFFNGHPNAVTRQRHGVGISLENRKKSVVDALAGLRCAFNTTHWSEDRSLDRRFTDWEYYAEVSLTPTSKWLIDTKLEYLIYSAAAFGQRRQIPLWQLGVTRYCLKGERGRIRLEAVNLLDQHLGVLRQSDFNYVRQQNTNALGRYLLLSFGYSLSGFRKDGALEIKMGG